MHKERLRKLAEVLENFATERHLLRSPRPIGKFDLGVWAEIAYIDHEPRQVPTCGYAACAVGTAMYHPWFQGHGLGVYDNHPVYREYPDRANDSTPLLEHWDAVEAFFDLSEAEATALFSFEGYPNKGYRLRESDDVTPTDVAAKIRAFIGDPVTTPLAVPAFDATTEVTA